MLITVVIESINFGSSGGFTQIVVDDQKPVSELISRFCDIKGCPVDPNYAILNDASVSFDNSRRISEYAVQDNDHLRLGRKRELNMFEFAKWSRISILGIAVALLGLIVTSLVYILFRQTPYKFGVIFDAGSSHTDAIVYSYHDKWRNTGQISQVANCSILRKGIADVPISNVSNYLGKCLEEAKSHITPPEALMETEVWFGATAGMRILREKNSSAVDSILSEVKKTLSNSGFFYEDANVDVITGHKEGLSGWTSVNFAKNGLKGANGTDDSSANTTTYGSLDLGGASMQVAVAVAEGNSSQNPFIYPVTLYEQVYNVYVQSFLCYGVRQAFDRYRAVLMMTQIQSQNGSVNISSPCEPIGFTYNKKMSDVFGLPCTLKSDSSFPTEIDSDTVYTFTGTNDVSSCQSNVTFLTSPELCPRLGSSHCLNSTYFPEEMSTSKFLAYSAFGHVMNDMNMSSVVAMDVFSKKLKVLCEMNYAHIIFWHTTFHLGISLRQLEELCFEGQYIYALLTKVFEFKTNEDWERIEFTTEVNGVGLSWSFGFMLNETSYMKESSFSMPGFLSTTSFWVLFSVFSLLLCFGIMFFYHARRLGAATYERKNSAYRGSSIHVISKSFAL